MGNLIYHSPAQVVAKAIVDQSAGTLPASNGNWPVYVSQEPDTPDNLITVYDTQGIMHGFTQIDGLGQDHHGVMIRVRGATYSEGYIRGLLLKKIFDVPAFINRTLVTIADTTYAFSYAIANVRRTGDLLSLGADKPSSRRRLFSLNATVPIEYLGRVEL